MKNIIAIQADVTKSEDCDRVVKAVLAQGGRLDMLVNNAGRGMRYVSERFLTEPTRFWETEPEVWRMVIDTNVNGPFLMSRACVPVMIAAGWGRIVNIFHESCHDATGRIFSIWPVQGSFGIRNGYLGAGPRRHRRDGERTAARRCHAHGHDPRRAPIPHTRRNLLDPSVIVPPLLWLASADADGVNRYALRCVRLGIPPASRSGRVRRSRRLW